MNDVLCNHRIYVMDNRAFGNDVVEVPQITTIVPYENVVSDISPFPGVIETLVYVAIKPKSAMTDRTFKLKVIKSIFEGFMSA